MQNQEGFLYFYQYYHDFHPEDFYDDTDGVCNFAISYNQEGNVISRDFFICLDFWGHDEASLYDHKLFCNGAIYDLKKKTLADLTEDIPAIALNVDHEAVTYLVSAATEEGILSAYWRAGKICYSLDGEQQEPVPAPPVPGVGDTPYLSVIKYSSGNVSTTGYGELLVGSNNLIVLLRTKGERTTVKGNTGTPADYYQIYSVKDKKWFQIENVSSTPGFPCTAVAERKPLFAAYDEDNRLIVYNAETEEVVGDWALDIDYQVVREMHFILDDSHLLIQTYSGGLQCYIVQLSDGEILFRHRFNSVVAENNYSAMKTTYDTDHHRIYLTDPFHHLKGVCVDTLSWKMMSEIPGLRCVLDDGTYVAQIPWAQNKTKLVRQRLYDLEELKEMARSILE